MRTRSAPSTRRPPPPGGEPAPDEANLSRWASAVGYENALDAAAWLVRRLPWLPGWRLCLPLQLGIADQRERA